MYFRNNFCTYFICQHHTACVKLKFFFLPTATFVGFCLMCPQPYSLWRLQALIPIMTRKRLLKEYARNVTSLAIKEKSRKDYISCEENIESADIFQWYYVLRVLIMKISQGVNEGFCSVRLISLIRSSSCRWQDINLDLSCDHCDFHGNVRGST